jgi:hypothetical protein
LIRVKRGEPITPNEPQANDNAPFDAKAWRRKYMKKYMREWRLRSKRAKDETS